MAVIAADLSAGPARLRKGYIDAAEGLVQIVDSDHVYSSEFVVYRITGYRPAGKGSAGEAIPGSDLHMDLARLILDICDSFDLRTADYDQRAKRFSVSTKTIQRWRNRGLVARRLLFPDGRKRLGFLDSSIQHYIETHGSQINRSRKFSHLTDDERADIIRRAKRMAKSTDCGLSDVARRLTTKTGRAIETIRYTIRRHDQELPDEAVFPSTSIQLTDKDKRQIYRNFLNGMSITALTKKFSRTRGTIYRIVNEIRAKQLLHRGIAYIPNSEFEESDADEKILSSRKSTAPDNETGAQLRAKPPSGLPPYLRALYEVPLLNAQQERTLFQRYNYLKFKADNLRGKINLARIQVSHLRKIEALLLQVNVLKNRIIRANLRLVVSIAKKHVSGPKNLFELISDGNVALMRAVEKFDFSRGFRFSTYASWAIMRNFARSVPKERYQLDRFSTGHEEILDIAASLQSYDPNDLNLSELRESIDVMLSQLSPRERTIIIDHYGLDETSDSQTFDQLGRRLGISKERVRQIELQALQKLRRIKPQAADLLS